MLIMLHNPIAQGIMIAKLQNNLIIVFFKAVICGILIYAAVDQFKNGKEYAPLIAVPAFILCGAEHCIADICFFISAGILNWNFIPFLLVVIIGNSIGSLLFDFIKKY